MTAQIRFDKDGLVPVVVQDVRSLEVLMVAYMNAEALRKTLATGEMHYWSRSRRSLWHKGESSGHVQRVRDARADCDQDCLLFFVEQTGAACHEGYQSCFFRRLDAEQHLAIVADRVFDPSQVYPKGNA